MIAPAAHDAGEAASPVPDGLWSATWFLYGWTLLAACPILADPVAPPMWAIVEAAVWWLGVGWVACRLALALARDRRWAVPIVGLALLGPHLVDPLSRTLLGVGRPYEIRLLAMLVDLGLAALVLGCPVPGTLRTGAPHAARTGRSTACAAATSLFVIVFAAALGGPGWTRLVTAGYALAGTLWLSIAFRRCRGPHPALPDRRVGWGTQAAIGLLLAGLAVCGGGRNVDGAGGWAEWLPTSGGTGAYDPFARGGVNDGDRSTAARKNPLSTGDLETDVFLDSPRPSLYDLYNDMTGEPKLPEDSRRAIALPWNPTAERPEPPSRRDRPAREFSTLRHAPDRGRTPPDEAADAPAYVRGPAPWHLRVEVFERFDGVIWTAAAEPLDGPALEHAPGSAADRLRPRARRSGSETAARQSRDLIVGLHEGNRIPTPEGLVGVRIAKVDDPSFYYWAQEEVLALKDLPRIPEATSIALETADARDAADFSADHAPAEGWEDTFAVPIGSEASDRARDLAAAWTREAPRGWPQIEAVERRLRTEFALAAGATARDDAVDTVGDFLAGDRPGPTYLFASAAAVILRWAGYPTRLASGYYVRPERYDAVSGVTPILKDDLHFWAEVRLPDGRWAIVEASPGFERSPPPATWASRLRDAAAWCVRRIRPFGPALACGAVLVGACIRFRRRLADGIATFLWSRKLHGTPEAMVTATAHLLDGRARRAGRPRPRGWTWRRWADHHASAWAGSARTAAESARRAAVVSGAAGRTAAERAARRAEHVERAAADWHRLARRHEAVAFAPPGASRFSPADVDELRSLCRRLAAALTFAEFAALPGAETAGLSAASSRSRSSPAEATAGQARSTAVADAADSTVRRRIPDVASA